MTLSSLTAAACGHRVCRKLAGCAFRPHVASPVRTGNCPHCGTWLQNGEAEHHRVVHAYRALTEEGGQ